MSRSLLLEDILYPVSDTMKFCGEPVIFLNTSDIELGKFLHKNFSKPSGLPGQAKKRIRKDDILLSEIRPANGRFAYVDLKDTEKYVVSTKLMVLRSKEGIFPKYAYFWLTAPRQLNQFQTIAESRSGTFPQVTFDTIKHVAVELPDYNNQVKIADFIDKIDENIELNRKMNETLEQMGQALFRHYFVDNVETSRWTKELSLDDEQILEVIKPRINIFDGYKEYIATANVSKNSIIGNFEQISYKKRPSRANMQPVKDSIWFAKMMGEHKAIIIDEFDKWTLDCSILSTGFMGLLPKNKFLYYVWSFINSDIFANEKNSLATGAVMVALNNGAFSKIKIKIPPDNVLEDFNIQVSEMYKLISANSREIKNLTTLRDTLLPRLMNGKIKL